MDKVNVLGSLESKFESTSRIYDVGGCSPTLSTMQGGNQEPKILENQIVAMRGRNPGNPSDRIIGNSTEQRLEPNMSGTSNCLTSIQKDNLVLESNVLTPKRTKYGKNIRKAYESGEIKESRHNMTELEPRKDGVSNTLTTVQKDNLLIESVIAIDEQNMNAKSDVFETLTTDGSSPKHNNRIMIRQATKERYIECDIGGVFDASYPNSSTRRGRVQDNGNISPTITSQNQELYRLESAYRIRKLTPRECGRLMGVSDEDISKMATVNSNSQLYKQFGNSIVVDVMCAMFKNLNINQ